MRAYSIILRGKGKEYEEYKSIGENMIKKERKYDRNIRVLWRMMIKKGGDMTYKKSYNDYSSRQIHEREMRKRIKLIIRIGRQGKGIIIIRLRGEDGDDKGKE